MSLRYVTQLQAEVWGRATISVYRYDEYLLATNIPLARGHQVVPESQPFSNYSTYVNLLHTSYV